jgi:hypothetical protein
VYSTKDRQRYNKLCDPGVQHALRGVCMLGVAELKLKPGEGISKVAGFACLHHVVRSKVVTGAWPCLCAVGTRNCSKWWPAAAMMGT